LRSAETIGRRRPVKGRPASAVYTISTRLKRPTAGLILRKVCHTGAMEFRCRLGTAGGEVIEGIYIADSEARLRRDLEEKGLFVLSLQPRGALSGLSALGTRRRRISRQEFLVFNQELATLLKAGMPLTQSLEILRQRVENPTFKA